MVNYLYATLGAILLVGLAGCMYIELDSRSRRLDTLTKEFEIRIAELEVRVGEGEVRSDSPIGFLFCGDCDDLGNDE
jgi:hypothetical protein